MQTKKKLIKNHQKIIGEVLSHKVDKISIRQQFGCKAPYKT